MTKTRNRTSAIGRKPDTTQQDSVAASTNVVVLRQTKTALLRAMLEAPSGASLTRIMSETGWQAHTVRAALTGLRKAGLHLTRRREADDTIYVIDAAAKVTADKTGDGNDDCSGSVEADDATLIPDADGSSPTSTDHGAAAAEDRA